MVEGILVVNLDPPYVGFVQKESKTPGDNKRLKGSLKTCTVPELRQMLLDLGAITPQQPWPPRDCTISLPGSYSAAVLAKVGLDAPTKAAS